MCLRLVFFSGPEPCVNVLNSRYSEQIWSSTHNEQPTADPLPTQPPFSRPLQHTDVTFLFHDARKLSAHRLVLSCVSPLFRHLFGIERLHGDSHDIDRSISGHSNAALPFNNAGNVFDDVSNTDDLSVTFKVKENIDFKAFEAILKFVYTGKPRRPQTFPLARIFKN